MRPPQHGQHRDGAIGASVQEHRPWLPGHGQERTCASEVRLTRAIAEQPVMADAVKAVRQHVQQKATDDSFTPSRITLGR